MWDVTSIVKSAWAMIVAIFIEFIKLPLKIWFIYIPTPVRYSVIGVLVLLSIFFIVYAIRNRDEWLRVY